MAESKASDTPVTRLKRKLDRDTPSLTASKRARQDYTPKPKPTRESPPTRRTPAQDTPSGATDVDASFVTAYSDLDDETPKSKAAASSQAKLKRHTENGWSELQGIASDGLANGQPEAELEKHARRRKRKEEKKARKWAQKTGAEKSLLNGRQAVEDSTQEIRKSVQSKQRRHEQDHGDAPKDSASETVDNVYLDWTLTNPTAGRFLDQDPSFVRDASGKEALITAKDYEVQLCSLESSLVQTSHKAPAGLQVASVASSEGGDGAVHIAYTDGTSTVWDTRSNSHTSTPEPRYPAPHFLAVKKKSNHPDEVFSIAINKGRTEIRLDGKPIFQSQNQLFALRLIRGSDFVLALGRLAVILGRRNDSGSAYVWVELPVRRAITCGDARVIRSKKTPDAAGLQLAIGNIDGQIHLYDNVSALFTHSSPALPSERVLHWHSEPVCALKFSPDGNYLFSGGRETVLVLWQLTTGKKHFLPHLTSTIERIAVNGTGNRVAMQMGDNSIMVISTSELKPIANFAGLQVAQPVMLDAKFPNSQSSIVLNPTSQNQVLVAVPASQPRLAGDVSARPFLQTYDVRDGRHIARQALTRNNVTDFRLGPNKEPIVPPDVSHVQISKDGQWLATIDEWTPPMSDMSTLAPQNAVDAEEKGRQRREVYLKFWRWDVKEQIWILITRSDAPHTRHKTASLGAGKVFSLAVDPSAERFATLGEDGMVRIWASRLRERAEVTAQNSQDGIAESKAWFCKRIIELPQDVDRADSPIAEQEEKEPRPESGCLAFSEDGSMLAAAQNMSGEDSSVLVHFIQVSTGEVFTKANVAPSLVNSLAFVDRYFVAVGRKVAHVWDYVDNTLNCRLAFPADGPASPTLAVNHSNKTFAIAVDRKLSVYKLGDDQKIHETTLEKPLTALLASQRGYVLLFPNATVRRLLPVNLLAQDLPAEFEEESSIDAMARGEDASIDLVNRFSNTSLTAEARAGAAVEDDRPVVRPQQLANALDAANTVEDMFQAVFGLFGRRPRPNVAAVSS